MKIPNSNFNILDHFVFGLALALLVFAFTTWINKEINNPEPKRAPTKMVR